jgi:hypothetical protein
MWRGHRQNFTKLSGTLTPTLAVEPNDRPATARRLVLELAALRAFDGPVRSYCTRGAIFIRQATNRPKTQTAQA